MGQSTPLPPSHQDGTSDEHSATPDPAQRLRGRHATSRGSGFEGVVGWTILGSIVPGLGLLVAGRRTLGRLLLAVTGVVALGAVALLALGNPVERLAHLVTDPQNLVVIAALCGALALLWAAIVVATHLTVRRGAALTPVQTVTSAVLVAGLIGVGVIPAYEGGSYALITRDTLTTVFREVPVPLSTSVARPVPTAVDPWAATPRVNLLLIGSDDGKGRDGVRPDTLIVASIDTASGDTVLFSLPRNLQRVPFPPGSRAAADFPRGFTCYDPKAGGNTECLLNGIWVWAESNRELYYRGDPRPGLTATVQAAEQVTGLRIDNYARVNLQGFAQFVDAIGGVTLTVTRRLPVGGRVVNGREVGVKRYLEVGRREMGGYDALWFARSRSDSDDYDRMRRQRCVIGAVVQQSDPLQLARAFPRIAAAARQNLEMDIPLSDLDAWVTLALRIKGASVRSLPFTNDVINPSRPDFARVHALVRAALRPPPPAPYTAGAPTASPSRPAAGNGRPPTARPGTSASSPSTPARPVDVQEVC